MKNLIGISTVFLLSMLVVIGCGKNEEKPSGKVFISEPKDGGIVKSPFKVVMGVEGMTIKPAGEIVSGTGHHHLLINGDPIPAGTVIPNDDTHKHFGKGETEATLELAPGDYKITLQFADGLHQSYGPEFSSTINVKVVAP